MSQTNLMFKLNSFYSIEAFLKSLKAKFLDLLTMKTLLFYNALRIARTKQIDVFPYPISNFTNIEHRGSLEQNYTHSNCDGKIFWIPIALNIVTIFWSSSSSNFSESIKKFGLIWLN